MKPHSSPPITAAMAAHIKAMLKRGLHQHQIAARFGINQGRVSEIKTGKLYPDVRPARGTQADFFD